MAKMAHTKTTHSTIQKHVELHDATYIQNKLCFVYNWIVLPCFFIIFIYLNNVEMLTYRFGMVKDFH